MAAPYKLHWNGKSVIRNGIETIPADPTIPDYREYLRWVALGNTADPADPEPVLTPALIANGAIPPDPDRTAIQAAVGDLVTYIQTANAQITPVMTIVAVKTLARAVILLLRRTR